MVLVLDDLHAADRPSLLLLQFIARQLYDASILVIGTYRELEARRHSEVAQVLGDLVRDGHRISLTGLNERDIARFVENAMRRPPSDTLIAGLHEVTEGNPFFLDEIVRLWMSERTPGDKPERLKIPSSVREAIGRRLSPMSEEGRRALWVASVIGREFDLACLQPACGLALDKLLNLLGEAEANAIAVRNPSMPSRFSFAHALFRETLYDELSPLSRIALHRRVGEVMEDVYQAEVELHLPELAHHFFESVPLGEIDKAIDYATRAATRAESMLAYEEAAKHYERARLCLELKPGADRRQICDLLLDMGSAQFKSGETASATRTFLRATAIARELRDPERLAYAALGPCIPVATLWTVDWERVELLEEAAESLREQYAALRARVLSQLVIELMFAGPEKGKAALASEGLKIARLIGEPRALLEALTASHIVLGAPVSDSAGRLALTEEMKEVADALGSRQLIASWYAYRIFTLLEAGEIVEADRAIAERERLAEELRQPRYQVLTPTYRTMQALVDGRFAEAQALAPQIVQLGRLSKYANAERYHWILMFRLRVDQGRVDELEEQVRQAAEQHPSIAPYRCALAALYAELGRQADARREFERMAGRDFADIPHGDNWFSAVHLAIACVFLADRRRAAVLYRLLQPHAALHAVAICPVYLGAISHHLGTLAATMGRYEKAEKHFKHAIEIETRVGARPWLARTQNEYAKMLLDRNEQRDHKKAAPLIADALLTAQALGMKTLEEKILTLEAASALHESQLSIGASAQDASERFSNNRNVFRKEGEYWTISYANRIVRLKSTKGLQDIAVLLSRPNKRFHVPELIRASEGSVAEPRAERYGAMSVEQLGEEGLSLSASHESNVLDPHARTQYKARLAELQSEVEDAERCNDPGRLARAQAEFDVIERELASAVGPAGKLRKFAGNRCERERKAVTERIRYALAAIAGAHPSLGRHLRQCVRTGAFSSYNPGEAESWEI